MDPMNFIVFYGCLLVFLVTSVLLVLKAINTIIDFHTTRIIKSLAELQAQQWKDSQK